MGAGQGLIPALSFIMSDQPDDLEPEKPKTPIYSLFVVVRTTDGRYTNVIQATVEAKSYREAQIKSYFALRALGYDVIRFLSKRDNWRW